MRTSSKHLVKAKYAHRREFEVCLKDFLSESAQSMHPVCKNKLQQPLVLSVQLYGASEPPQCKES